MTNEAVRKRCEDILADAFGVSVQIVGVTPADLTFYRAAYADGRHDGMEEAADLAEVQELADPSGLSRGEQLRIYSAIRQQAGEVTGA